MSAADVVDPAGLWERIRPEFDAVDLTPPLPDSVRVGVAIGRLNRHGLEPDEQALRMAVLADRQVITTDEAVALLTMLARRAHPEHYAPQ